MLLRYGPLDGEQIDGRGLRGGPVIIRSDKCPDHLVEYTPSKDKGYYDLVRLHPPAVGTEPDTD
jgi:hypothetical protein